MPKKDIVLENTAVIVYNYTCGISKSNAAPLLKGLAFAQAYRLQITTLCPALAAIFADCNTNVIHTTDYLLFLGIRLNLPYTLARNYNLGHEYLFPSREKNNMWF